MTGFLLDVRVAWRALLRARTLTGVAIICLALGVGANVAVFSVVRAVLLERLPFPDPDRLVGLWVNYGADQVQTRFFLSPQQFIEIRDRNAVFGAIAASRTETMSLDEGDFPTEVAGARVTASLFDLVGATPVVGRTITPEEDDAGAPVAVISEGLWARSFGSRRDILGAPLRLGGSSFEIVGVLGGGVRVPPEVDVWVPLSVDRVSDRERVSGTLTALGRLASGASLQGAAENLGVVAAEIAQTFPDRNFNLNIGVASWQDTLVETVRPALVVLMFAVAGVLSLAVLNVAGLLIVRARRERRHQAMRSALGASTARILRYIVIENGLLVLMGSVVGVAAAYAVLPALLALQPSDLSPFRDIQIDSGALLFGLLIAGTVTAVISLFTVLQMERGSLVRRLLDGGTGAGVTRGSLLAQRTLVVVQIAASAVLVVGSFLLTRSFFAIQRTDPGFVADSVLVIRLGLPPARSATLEQRGTLLDEVLARVRSTPGVVSAGAAHVLPVTDTRWGVGFNVEGQPPTSPSYRHVAVFRRVTVGYYDAMRIPIVRGRSFDERDRLNTEAVAVVSESIAREYWPGEDPIGKRVKRGTYNDPSEPWRTVIGVMPDVSDSALAGRPRASLHFLYSQFVASGPPRVSAAIRVNGDPREYASAVVAGIREVDGSILVSEVAPYTDLLGDTITQERFNTLLMIVFSTVGLLLAAVGIYGVVSYAAAQRRAEFGIRLALGAEGREVRGLMLRSGGGMALVGVGMGVLFAYGIAPAVESLLRTGDPRAPFPYVISAAVLFATTVVAAWVPANRATRIDLSSTLRR